MAVEERFYLQLVTDDHCCSPDDGVTRDWPPVFTSISMPIFFYLNKLTTCCFY
jgi:hypothetical protein